MAWWCGLLVAVVLAWATPVEGQGLVVQDGRFTQNGQEYRGLGVNYYSAFLNHLRDRSDTSFDAGFAGLAEKDIPFARFNAGGFWPDDWGLYQTDKAAYFARMDAVVNSATAHGVQLVPSLFWNHYSISDLFKDEAPDPDNPGQTLPGESANAWADPDSRTRRFARQYASEVVSRYANNDTILMWEFGNEFNLVQDLPTINPTSNIAPGRGTPDERDDDDVLSSDDIRGALTEFAQLVRGIDPHRAINSGNSAERAQAYNRRENAQWAIDTEAEFREIFAGDHPDPVDALSVHAYWHSLQGTTRATQTDPTRRFAPDQIAGYAAVLDVMLSVSSDTGKPLFLGEFGVADDFTHDVPDDGNPNNTTEERLQYILDLFTEKEVPVAAIWAYEFNNEEAWNITTTNDRAYQLDLISAVNASWQASVAEPTAGDLNGDGFVSQADLNLVLLNWGSDAIPDEWTAVEQFDGVLVGQNELNAVLLNWGSGQPPDTNIVVIPEPHTFGVLVIMLASVFSRMRGL
ncbi:MAG: cellulase family glycosylhydrolase [Planctomycetota bacterium]